MIHMARLLRPHPALLSAVVAASVLATLAEGLSVGLLLPLMDMLDGQTSLHVGHLSFAWMDQWLGTWSLVERVRWLAVGFVVLAIVKMAVDYWTSLLSYRLQIAVDRRLRLDVFRQLLDVDIGFIHRHRAGGLFTILNNYTGHSGRVAQQMAVQLTNALIITVYVACLLAISWPLTVVAVASCLLASVALNRLLRRTRPAGAAFNEAAMDMCAVGIESLSALATIKLFGRDAHVYDQYRRVIGRMQDRLYQKGRLESFVKPLFHLVSTTMMAIIIIAGTMFFTGLPNTWIPILMLFVVIMIKLAGPAATLNGARNAVAGYLPSVEAVFDFLFKNDKALLVDGTQTFTTMQSGVQFDQVVFRYEDGTDNILNDVSFHIPRGSTTAIVGASGVGKSTLVNLLVRLYDPQAGNISIDGVDLRAYAIDSWRSRVGVVSQDTFIFNDTVLANIQFGYLAATEEEIVEASRRAYAHDFIEQLPQGYHTLLGDRGVRLSVGQRQRLAIARALVADPELLILDEATSALDTITERQVQEAFAALRRGRTVLAIAHRLSTIADVDHIIVLHDGRVAEAGTHGELLAARGHYWRLVHLQQLDVEVDGQPSVSVMA